MSRSEFRKLGVFLGSSPGRHPEYDEAARALGGEIVARQLTLVFGGSDLGTMGALADAVLEKKGRVVGVIPQAMVTNGWHHDRLTELRVVANMHERKRLMYSLSDAVVALPGGLGTFDEFVEFLTWNQLGIHRKPLGLLNVRGYFEPLLEMFTRAIDEGFLRKSTWRDFMVAETPESLLDNLEHFDGEPYEP